MNNRLSYFVKSICIKKVMRCRIDINITEIQIIIMMTGYAVEELSFSDNKSDFTITDNVTSNNNDIIPSTKY